jgi:RNA polymerase sigma factor (sigma-70 family)
LGCGTPWKLRFFWGIPKKGFVEKREMSVFYDGICSPNPNRMFSSRRLRDEPDEVLLAEYRSHGDAEVLGLLLCRYTGLLFGVARKYLKDTHLAEDAVQQVFLKVLTSLPDDEIPNFKGWLYVLMRNHSIQYLRKAGRNQEKELPEIGRADPIETPDFDLQEDVIGQIHEALEGLQPDQRTAITLFYIEKYSYGQIMAATGFSFMQVKSFIQNGKRNLKNSILKKSARK